MSQLIILADSPDALRKLLEEVLSDLKLNPQTSTAEDSLITTDEACRLLSISKTTLCEWKKNGQIPYVKLGKRIYFEKAKLIEAGRSHEKYQRKK